MPLPSIRILESGRVTGRARRALLWIGVGIGFLLLVLYHGMLASIGQPPTVGTRIVADLLALLTFGALGYLMAGYVSSQARRPIKMLWFPLAAGGLGMALGAVLVMLTGSQVGLDPATGLPTDFRSVLQMSGVTAIEIAIAFVVLFSLQGLVLFRRTPASVRHWRLMLVLMVAASAVLAGRNPALGDGDHWLHIALTVLAVVLMVANAFRLAWIAYLPFRQKVHALFLSLGLILLLVVLLASHGGGWMGAFAVGAAAPDPALGLAAAFSAPASRFIELVLAFGILYGSTAMLALLFHLPTARAMQQKSGEMEALQALARLSTELFDRERLVSTIAGAPVDAGVAQAAWLALIEPERGSVRPHLVAAHGLTPAQIEAMTDSQQLAADALRQQGPLVLQQAPADHRVHALPGDGIGSLVVLPLRVHEETLGVLFATRAVPHGFERDDVAALETFASQAALSISNARLFRARLEHERAARELAIAREVQRRLLPACLPCTPQVCCAAVSLPAYEVAGDYYDYIELDGARLGLIVADVSGKGSSAAFHMAEMKGAFQALGPLEDSPARLLVRANEALSRSLHRSAFITAVYAILDQERGHLTVARAGHCPPLLAGEDGVRLLRPGGLGIGLDRGTLFAQTLEEAQQPLQPGDLLLLYTDGLVEARDAAGEEFGYERLVDAVARRRRLEPDALRDALVAEVRAFAHATDGQTPGIDDDLTLVILQWSGAPAGAPASTAPSAEREAPFPT